MQAGRGRRRRKAAPAFGVVCVLPGIWLRRANGNTTERPPAGNRSVVSVSVCLHAVPGCMRYSGCRRLPWFYVAWFRPFGGDRLPLFQRYELAFGGDVLVGRTVIRLLSKFSSSMRCAVQPVMRLIAKSGVKTSAAGDHVVDEARVEVDVRADALVDLRSLEIHEVFDRALLEQFEECVLLFTLLLFGQVPGHLLEQQCARVGNRIDRMADAVDQPGVVVGLFAQHLVQVLVDFGYLVPVPGCSP